MTLASGADVKIGDYEFFLDNSELEPYAHVLESLYSDTQKIAGVDAATANPNILLWTYDDMAGGAENKYYSEVIPDSYWYGTGNPRIRGSIQGPPDTGTATKTLTVTSPTQWLTTTVSGKMWAAAGRDLFYSSDGETWSQWNSTALAPAGYTITGLTHDGEFPMVIAQNSPVTTWKTYRITSTTTSDTWMSDRTTTDSVQGMTMLEGQIYVWTGAKLFSYDSTDDTAYPLTHSSTTNKVHQPFNAGGDYGGIAASESSIFYFTAGGGSTHVFEYRFSSATNSFIGRPVWNLPQGFTGRFMTCSMGVVYVLGEYGNQVSLFGMSQVNREPLFLSYVGQAYGGNSVTLTPRGLSGSYGAQVLLSIDDGTTNYYYVYDAEIDSMSQLDEQTIATDGTNYALETFGQRRVAIGNGANTTAKFRYWKMDFDTPTRGWQWVSSAWHQGFPMDEKLLFGFQVTQDPSLATATVKVEYQIDEDGTWTTAGTTSAGAKYTNFDLSANNVKYRILRLRLTGTNGARLFSVTTRAYINSYQEIWRLVLKMRDERPNARQTGRPASRQVRAEKLRGYLNTLATTKSVVTFLDGRSSPTKGSYTTHKVVVEFPRSGGTRIRRASGKGHHEGSAEVNLRSTAP